MNKNALIALLIFGATFASNTVFAQHHGHEDAHHPRGHDAHVHGAAELFIIQEGDQLEIALHSPAVNLFGFEHSANTAAKRKTVKHVRDLLANEDAIFSIEPKACRLLHFETDFANIDTSSLAADQRSHSDAQAHYRYQCSAKPINVLSTQLLALFPAIESLHVQWLINHRQGAIVLDNSANIIHFR